MKKTKFRFRPVHNYVTTVALINYYLLLKLNCPKLNLKGKVATFPFSRKKFLKGKLK